jgi:tetratricopeptide (TPR) repeat protein
VTVEERIISGGEILPLPAEPDITAQPLPDVQSVSPVVQRLMAAANTEFDNGNTDAAANSLERALRIEPRNAFLWNKLASIRFSQQDWQQAIQLAAKSNTLSANDLGLRRQNWNLMGNAYEALGDAAAAERYRAKLRLL